MAECGALISVPPVETEALNIDIRSWHGVPGPARALVMTANLTWGGQRACLLDIAGTLSTTQDRSASVVSTSTRMFPISGGAGALLLHNGGIFGFELWIGLSDVAIHHIEESRMGGDLALRLDLAFKWQDLMQFSTTEPDVVAGPAQYEQRSPRAKIPQSEWIKRLREMEWADTRLFEMPLLPLEGVAILGEAFKHLREAEDALRDGKYPGVLVQCRMALESAAKHASSGGDLKQGFDALLGPLALEAQAKKTIVNELIIKLTDYAHLARHADCPPVRFGRDEAEFVLTTTVALFSMISRRLKEPRS